MTEQEMIKVYWELDSKCGDIHDQIDDLEDDRNVVCDEMDGMEDEWLETHRCYCALRGTESSCEHDKN